MDAAGSCTRSGVLATRGEVVFAMDEKLITAYAVDYRMKLGRGRAC